MNMRIPEWGLALVLAIFTHMALAIGFGGRQETLVERGPGDGGPLIVGSLMDSIIGDDEAEEVTEADAVNESEDIPEMPPIQEIPPLKEVPEIYETGLVKISQDPETRPVTQKLAANIIHPDELNIPVPEELLEASANAVLPPLPQEVEEAGRQTPVMEETRKPEIRPTPVKKKPEKKKSAKKKPRTKGAKANSRRGGSGGRGRAGGGGGKGLSGRAMMSNYKGRVVAHLRRYKFYPKEARRRGIKGLVRVRFTINAAGRVISSRLVSRSGSSVLDSGARSTIRRANPFPSFPKGLGKKRMTFVVPIRFNSR